VRKSRTNFGQSLDMPTLPFLHNFECDFITARCTLVQSAVLQSYIVCPSVCPSVTISYRDHIGWNSSKIISRRKLRACVRADPNMGDLVQREHPPKLGRNRGGVTRERKKPAISRKWCTIGPRLLLRTNRKSCTCFRLVPKSVTLGDLEWCIQGLPKVF